MLDTGFQDEGGTTPSHLIKIWWDFKKIFLLLLSVVSQRWSAGDVGTCVAAMQVWPVVSPLSCSELICTAAGCQQSHSSNSVPIRAERHLKMGLTELEDHLCAYPYSGCVLLGLIFYLQEGPLALLVLKRWANTPWILCCHWNYKGWLSGVAVHGWLGYVGFGCLIRFTVIRFTSACTWCCWDQSAAGGTHGNDALKHREAFSLAAKFSFWLLLYRRGLSWTYTCGARGNIGVIP